MYSKSEAKSARHEWIPSASNTGILSYVYVRTFAPFAGDNMFTSMTCPTLSSSTILQIPRTHILFSLASSSADISVQSLRSSDGHPLSILTFDTGYSAKLFNLLREQCDALYAAAELLKKATSAATKEFRDGPAPLEDGEGESEDEDVEEDDLESSGRS